MNYNMFKECILEGMKEVLGEEVEYEIKEVLKNNGIVLDGLVISRKDKKISPTIYLNDFYKEFLEGKEINEIITIIMNIYKENVIDEVVDVGSLMDFDKIKSRIVYKLINLSMNDKLLETVPYREYLDLAIVYYVVINDEVIENATVLINNKWIEEWGVTEETLYNVAKENSPVMFKPEIVNIKDMVMGLMEDKMEEEEISFPEEECNMYVLTNDKKHFGAATILYDNILKDFAKKNNCDVYILPSSIHELILLPSNDFMPKDGLTQMVREVNSTQVPYQEILSDHAYLYNALTDSVSFC